MRTETSYFRLRGIPVSVVESFLTRVANRHGEEWVGSDESSLPYLENMINGALKRVVMITGELDPRLYELTTLPQTVKEALSRGVKFDIIFHKECENIGDARERLLIENKKLISLAKEYPSQVCLYWREKRPVSHYMVADSNALFIEEPHDAYGPRRAIAKRNSLTLGKRLEERFDALAHRADCHPLNLATN